MKKILDLDDWIKDKYFPDEKRFADISIRLKFPDIKELFNDPPETRNKKIDEDLRFKFKKLISTNLISDYKLIGSKRRPRGIETKVPYTSLSKLNRLPFIEKIFINSLGKARKRKQKKLFEYYCIKMTVAIEIEGQADGYQKYEERFVLLKAKSFDDAYDKLEKRKKDYSEPYLNSKGRLVRWRIESFDDCYETFIEKPEEMNKPGGCEVYSTIKNRRMTKERFWDGNLE